MLKIFFPTFSFHKSFLFTLTTIILYTFSVYKSREMLELFFHFYFHNSFTFPILILLLYHKRCSLSRDKVVKTFSFLGLFTLLWKRFHFFFPVKTLTWKRFHTAALFKLMKTLTFFAAAFTFYENAFIPCCCFFILWKRFHFSLREKTFTLKNIYVKP